MQPMPGVRLTLITDRGNPILGHAAGPRRRRLLATRGPHRFEQARASGTSSTDRGEVTHIDSESQLLHLKDGRPPLPYDVCSINVGIAPSKPAAYVTPVKPIATFSVKWDALLSRLDDDSSFRLVVVGGGAGGVELYPSDGRRVSAECGRRGRSLTCLSATLVARSSELLQGHAVGVRRC